jgi:hypothetical protein
MRARHFALVSLLATAPLAQALTLDFGNDPDPAVCSTTDDGLGAPIVCGNWGWLSQSYGDVAGVVDVTYSAPRLAGRSLEWWADSYNNLWGVAFAPGSDADSQARIELLPVQPGDGVTLTGFDIGAYPNLTRDTTVNIFAVGGGPALFSYSGPVGDGAISATHFAVNVSSSTGLWIEWQDNAYNVGIDNIEYTVAAIPEPASYALFALGLAAVGALRRARRSV